MFFFSYFYFPNFLLLYVSLTSALIVHRLSGAIKNLFSITVFYRFSSISQSLFVVSFRISSVTERLLHNKFPAINFYNKSIVCVRAAVGVRVTVFVMQYVNSICFSFTSIDSMFINFFLFLSLFLSRSLAVLFSTAIYLLCFLFLILSTLVPLVMCTIGITIVHFLSLGWHLKI